MQSTIQEVLISIWSWFKKPKQYNNTFAVYSVGGNITPGNCAEMTFVNQGSATVTINQAYELATKEFLAFDGKKNEVDTSVYSINFGPTGTKKLVVIRKYYNTTE